jgi:hypothetical protein
MHRLGKPLHIWLLLSIPMFLISARRNMSKQEPIKAILAGGNPRSLERTEEVVALVLGNRTRLHELNVCLLEEDETRRDGCGQAMPSKKSVVNDLHGSGHIFHS